MAQEILSGSLNSFKDSNVFELLIRIISVGWQSCVKPPGWNLKTAKQNSVMNARIYYVNHKITMGRKRQTFLDFTLKFLYELRILLKLKKKKTDIMRYYVAMLIWPLASKMQHYYEMRIKTKCKFCFLN